MERIEVSFVELKIAGATGEVAGRVTVDNQWSYWPGAGTVAGAEIGAEIGSTIGGAAGLIAGSIISDKFINKG